MTPNAPDHALAAAYAQCFDAVRDGDRDLWLASLFWPADKRPHAQALLAFGLEIARVRDIVSEPMLGEIRHQWWREAIEHRQAGGNPIAEALLDTVARFNLDAGRLLALIEAHGFDLYDDPMPSETALEGYLRDTSATLFEAVARVLAAGRLAPICADAAGRAYGLTNLLRGLPWQVMRGQLFLPLDLLETFQLPPDHVLAHRDSPALRLVLNALRVRVRNHLDDMRAGLESAGAAAPACLPAFLCKTYLRRMDRPAFHPFETPLDQPRWRRQWALWRAARRL